MDPTSLASSLPTSGGDTADDRIKELTTLLSHLEEPPPAEKNLGLRLSPEQENALIQVRLGIASSLFTALKWKHEPTARHCLRVALACSAWVHRIGLPPERCDEIEMAALLHDIGKIGVPDEILNKPTRLVPQEKAVVDGHWLVGLEILRACCASKSLQDTLLYTPAWYDGSRRGLPLLGEAIPLGSRIVAIMDAYDSMTSDQDYRPALSRDEAIQELYRCAGRQFDPKLVKSFCELKASDESKLLAAVPRRWLQQLDPAQANKLWKLDDRDAPSPQLYQTSLFQECMIANLDDAVIFVDAEGRVIRWSPGAERLTGVAAESVHLRPWAPSLLHLRDEHGCLVRDEHCPVSQALTSGMPWTGKFNLRCREGHVTTVKARAVPVISEDGTTQGMVIVMHDVSHEASLQEHCENLRDLATRDPLTQLANRAEFDRLFDEVVAGHADDGRPCSLIITDIDYFKQVNDNYGHQAGDEVIKAYAALMRGSCRTGDLVARYGGEEFVMICVDCDSATVTRRAEQLREAFARTQHEAMGGKKVTASYGVTEIQPGDTAATMLSRADRALLMAKEQGRNRVVSEGTGNESANKPLRKLRRKFAAGEAVLEQHLASHVPLDVCVEKLRGFIADHQATVVELKGTHVVLNLTAGPQAVSFISSSDRPTRFTMELEFREERDRRQQPDGTRADHFVRTLIKVVIRPEKNRDRRQRIADDRARQLIISLRAYLMAVDPIALDGGVLTRAKNLFAPWLAKK